MAQTKQSSSLMYKLDESSWSIVHGTRESLDLTHLSTPLNDHLHFYNTQGLSPSSTHEDDGTNDEIDFDRIPSLRGRSGIKALMRFAQGSLGQRLLGKSFSMADANPVSIITERVSDTEQRLWTSGFKNVLVFQHIIGEPDLKLLARYDHGGFDFHYHGSYAFVAKKEGQLPTYVVAIKQDIYRFTLTGNEAEGYRLERDGPHLGVYKDEGGGEGDDDDDERNNMIGVTLSMDGTIVTATKAGNITALRDDVNDDGGNGPLRVISHLSLHRHVQSHEEIHISNSLSVHGQGIYIVTQEEMTRVDLDPETARLKFRWSTRYGAPRMPWYTSRLGPGSGSTPSITTCQGKEMVVITDGELAMNLIYLDAETGEELARAPISFGEGVDNSHITSEQSVAVRGCQAFVVNNYIGVDGIDDDAYCTLAPNTLLKKGLSRLCNSLQPEFISKVCPAVFGCVAYGAAMYNILPNPDGNPTYFLNRQWARDDLSCGTSIPLMSDPVKDDEPSTTYCIGMKRGGRRWGLVALDTETGQDRFPFYQFYKESARDKVANFFANPYYAGVEAIADHTLAIGSIGGVMYLTPSKPDDAADVLTATASMMMMQGSVGGAMNVDTAAAVVDDASGGRWGQMMMREKGNLGMMTLTTLAVVGVFMGMVSWVTRRRGNTRERTSSFDYHVLPGEGNGQQQR